MESQRRVWTQAAQTMAYEFKYMIISLEKMIQQKLANLVVCKMCILQWLRILIRRQMRILLVPYVQKSSKIGSFRTCCDVAKLVGVLPVKVNCQNLAIVQIQIVGSLM